MLQRKLKGFTKNEYGKLVAWRKPMPEETDEWTHYLHDPQGTMVAQDTVVGPPKRIQWMAGPKWLRNHDFMASISAVMGPYL